MISKPLSRSLTGFFLIVLLVLTMQEGESGDTRKDLEMQAVPILLYHRFGPAVVDSMTVTTDVFESHLKYLRDNGYTIIPLRQLVAHYSKKGTSLPPRSVVITVDDGHKSVYSHMLPIVKKYNIPVTLFIYPSAISNASYAMTWEHLHELKRTGLFDIQSHSYWHPHFRKDKKRLSPTEYEKSVEMQLRKSKEKLERELTIGVYMIAWPFGIYDDALIGQARREGYMAGFTIERRHAKISDNIMTLPRYLIANADRGKAFAMLLSERSVQRKAGY